MKGKNDMQQQNSVTVTILSPTAGQMLALNDILGAVVEVSGKPGKKGKPAKTVSPEEEEEFGTEAVEEEELEETEEEEEAPKKKSAKGKAAKDEEESEEEEETEEEGEEEETLSFDEVKAAINKYGEKKPDDMKAILLGFNMKSTKELQTHKTKWEPVYRKVQAKLKLLKKKTTK